MEWWVQDLAKIQPQAALARPNISGAVRRALGAVLFRLHDRAAAHSARPPSVLCEECCGTCRACSLMIHVQAYWELCKDPREHLPLERALDPAWLTDARAHACRYHAYPRFSYKVQL